MPLLIAVAGGSGSGKSTFARMLLQKLGEENAAILQLDNYYRPKEEQVKDENGIENFDLPQAFDQQKLRADLFHISQNQSLIIQTYTYNQEGRTPSFIEIPSKEYLIVEGIFALYFETVTEMSFVNIFLESDLEMSYLRRLYRDKKERGYDEQDVNYRYYRHALDSFERYILPSTAVAHLKIKNNGSFEELDLESSKAARYILNRQTNA